MIFRSFFSILRSAFLFGYILQFNKLLSPLLWHFNIHEQKKIKKGKQILSYCPTYLLRLVQRQFSIIFNQNKKSSVTNSNLQKNLPLEI